MHEMRDPSVCTIAQKLDAARLSDAASRPRGRGGGGREGGGWGRAGEGAAFASAVGTQTSSAASARQHLSSPDYLPPTFFRNGISLATKSFFGLAELGSLCE